MGPLDKAKETIEEVGDKVGEIADQVGDKVSDRVGDIAGSLSGQDIGSTKKANATSTGPKESGEPKQAKRRNEALSPPWAQQGERLTTATGVRVSDSDNSLTAGPRGPSLMEDFHLREKITHFDHERIPERVVHARGAGAHGIFELTESLADITKAHVFTELGKQTPMFVRFSTVAGSRGSMDTARDVRGFAARFYTDEGNFDLVGNNIPVFFIQDGIKFPDVIHAVKPEPDREIPQAASAHDTFWDFAGLQPETTHMLMWVMSDRAIPRSFRMMEGFGVHTFRLVNEAGATSLVKFHWKPVAGIHGLVWDEAQKLGGIDPDFHRRDLWNAIENGAYPEYHLGVQVMPDTPDQMFQGIDLLDPTKLVPEELVPVRIIGKLTLNANPANFFAETEQIAYHLGNLVPGVDVTDDPLLQARLFSYLDTQLLRLGGPNFNQLPINQPHAAVNDDHRDGYGQRAVHTGRAAYVPNSIGGGIPYASPEAGAYVHVPHHVAGPKVRQRPVSFDDHYSQATLFWNSMSPVERDHIVDAFSFELGKCESQQVVSRMVANLANVSTELCARVATNLGEPVPTGAAVVPDLTTSPALSMMPAGPSPLAGRVVGLLVGDDADVPAIEALAQALAEQDAILHIIAARGGTLAPNLPIHKTLLTTASVDLDALMVAGASTLAQQPKSRFLLQEAFAHYKTIGAWGPGGAQILHDAGISLTEPGVIVSEAADEAFFAAMIEAMGWHRHWGRGPTALAGSIDLRDGSLRAPSPASETYEK